MVIVVNRSQSGLGNPQFLASTTGVLKIADQQVAFTLEPSAKMIPPGDYPIKLLWSPRFKRLTPHLTVPGRTEIEIHGGNVATDSEGCILVAIHKLSDYEIYDSLPATDAIEDALADAEAKLEASVITIVGLQLTPS